MRIRKYRAPSINEAIAMVKETLGPDAMILSTRKLGEEGRGSLFEVEAVPAGDCHAGSDGDALGRLRSELMSIKQMIRVLDHSNGVMEELVKNPALMQLYGRLLKCGISAPHVRRLLERAGCFNGYATQSADILHRRVINEIGKAIRVKEIFEGEGGGKVIAAFVGTTGVGKTTTIAKLAALLMLKAGKRVGFISIDNYRVGAMDQLKTYASILGVPCFPAFNRQDLSFALNRMERAQVVLIDTAGQSQYDLDRIDQLRAMLPSGLSVGVHLLLSVSTTEVEMDNTIRSFEPLNVQSIIFTKLDEAQTCGTVLNQMMKKDLSVSYVTTGQNVPEDIEKATRGNILKRILYHR